MTLLPNYRIPTLIHTRTGNAKWLNEITIPIRSGCTRRRTRIGVKTGDLARVETEIGYFVDKVWVTEGSRPGVVACSHHLGRWRLDDTAATTAGRRQGCRSKRTIRRLPDAPDARRAAVQQ